MDFSPKTIDDVVIASEESRRKLQALRYGLYPRSNTRSMIIVLSGPKGTGKTTLARMLPAAIESAYTKTRYPSWESFPQEHIYCIETPDRDSPIKEIEKRSALGPAGLLSRTYVICDEIDNLSTDDQSRLYHLTFQPHVVFILTTNYRAAIDQRIITDAIDLIIDSPTEEALIRLAHRIATSENVVLFQHEAIEIARRCDHSWRSLTTEVETAIARRRQYPKSLTSFCDGQRQDKYGSTSRSRGSHDDYDPKFIDEILISNNDSRDVIERIVTGVTRPAHDSAMGILIFGRPMTGRKTLARMLPAAIEQCAYGDSDDNCDTTVVICSDGRDGIYQINSIAAQMKHACLGTVSGQRYITLLGVDSLSIDAQLNLRSLMNMPGNVFILVANSIARLDDKLVDRCKHKIYMDTPRSEQLRSLVESVLLSNNVTPTDALTDRILTTPFKSYAELYVLIMNEVMCVQVAAHSASRKAD